MRRGLALLALLLLPACGLPLPTGVQSGGAGPAAEADPPVLRVVPPGPQPGATAEGIVGGFLGAQGSPEDDRAVAREFLAPGTPWRDQEGAVVYRSRRVVPDGDEDPATIAVRFETVARISADGAFSPESEPVEVRFEVAPQPDGELRIVLVPPGLYLTQQDRDRAFVPQDVYFLARGLDGRPVERLVADRVFLPATTRRVDALVAAQLRGPTQPIRAATATAVPDGTELAAPVDVVEGVVEVDLRLDRAALDARTRQRLAAQLVWTLPSDVAGLRLTVLGEPLDGLPDVLTREDVEDYDPSGAVEGAPVTYVADRLVRSLDGSLPPSEATQPGGVQVDEATVNPATGQLALLTSNEAGDDEVRTGPPAGPFGLPVLRRGALGSPSWGPGDQGLWVLDRGSAPSGAQPAICLVPARGAPPGGDPCSVPYERPADAGPLSALRVSRDGARIALVFGAGEGRRLYVGRVEPTGEGRVRVSALAPVAPGLVDVTDVAWRSGTSLVVLAAAGASQVVPWTVPVDGSVPPAAVQTPGLPGDARAVAAAPGRPLVVSAVEGATPVLYREEGAIFQRQGGAGDRPRYPG